MTDAEAATSTLAPTRPPPGWPKPIGILSIVFGLLGAVLGTGAALLGPVVLAPLVEPQLGGAPLPPSLILSPPIVAYALVSALLNVLLIAAGVQLIRRKRAGRTLHLAYGVLLPIATFAGAYFQYQIQMATLDWARTYPDNPIAEQQLAAGEASQLIGLFGGVAVGLAWPVFCIVWFGLVKRQPEDLTGTPDRD